mmetsp:Transcript_39852/g.43173  ORF Transcript_39852/g.43173 Transcript_39852/m.43173 type:complete len:81 (-) Transcript_39852:1281-1523(-)
MTPIYFPLIFVKGKNGSLPVPKTFLTFTYNMLYQMGQITFATVICDDPKKPKIDPIKRPQKENSNALIGATKYNSVAIAV